VVKVRGLHVSCRGSGNTHRTLRNIRCLSGIERRVIVVLVRVVPHVLVAERDEVLRIAAVRLQLDRTEI
jgi:hypothetical protein